MVLHSSNCNQGHDLTKAIVLRVGNGCMEIRGKASEQPLAILRVRIGRERRHTSPLSMQVFPARFPEAMLSIGQKLTMLLIAIGRVSKRIRCGLYNPFG